MDIIAHALWATAAGKTWKLRTGKRFRVLWFALWTMFPDLFSFAPMVALGLWYRLAGWGPAPHVHFVGGVSLYQLSHSFVVFLPVFALASLALRRPVWTMLGWALHIAIDIPTHSHYLTPFLWPLSNYRFEGVGWWETWFMIANYATLAIVYLALWLVSRRREEGVRAEQPG